MGGKTVAASEDMAPIAAALNGFEQVSITSTAGTLASFLTGAAIPTTATHAIFYPEDQDVRWRADGTSPTEAIGIVMAKDTVHVFENQRSIFDNMKVVSGHASSAASLNVQWCK